MFTRARGTLLLAVITDHAAYLAADSRSVRPSSGSYHDDAQKIFKFSTNALAAISGNLIGRSERRCQSGELISEGNIDLTAVLRDLSATYTGDGTDLPSKIAANVHAILKPFWDLLIAPDPRAFLRSSVGIRTFCEIPIVVRRNRSTNILVVKFPFSDDGELLEPTIELRFSQARKDPERAITWGCTVDADEPELDDESPLGYIIEIFWLGQIACPSTVGGPIDIGRVDDDGVPWMVHKGNLDRPAVPKDEAL